jgi:hypothetical protein
MSNAGRESAHYQIPDPFVKADGDVPVRVVVVVVLVVGEK